MLPTRKTHQRKRLVDATCDEMSWAKENRIGKAPIWRITDVATCVETIGVRKPPLKKMTGYAPQ